MGLCVSFYMLIPWCLGCYNPLCLDIRYCDAPALFFGSRLLWLLMAFCGSIWALGLSFSLKNDICILIGNCVESVNYFGQHGHFNNINSNLSVSEVFLFFIVFFKFFHYYFVIFIVGIIHFLGYIYEVFLGGGVAIMNGIAYLNFFFSKFIIVQNVTNVFVSGKFINLFIIFNSLLVDSLGFLYSHLICKQ
jgi:hypothetical protein